MTTVTRTFTWAFGNSTALNAAINEVHTILSTAGLTQTTDTGQIALSGNTWVNAAATSYGYEIWKFPDALQSTTPIYIRVDYKSGSSASYPYFAFTVGGSTDGAGTLTTTAGPTTGPIGLNVGSSLNTSSPINSYACYTDSTFALVLGKGAYLTGSNNVAFASFVIDRPRSSTGVAQSGGFLLSYAVPGSTGVTNRHWYGVNTLATTNYAAVHYPNPNITGTVEGTSINVMRAYMATPGIHPSLGYLGYFTTEIADLTPQTFTVLGSSHTYMPMGTSFNNLNNISGAAATMAAMIRWE